MLKAEIKQAKIKALGIHVFISFLIFLAVVGYLVFYSYPSFYFGLSGGLHGLGMMFAIDMVIGPLLTLVVYNPNKSIKETIIDFSVIAVIQFTALAYGFHKVESQRPKLLMIYENSNASAVPAYTVDWVGSLRTQLDKTSFTIEGVKAVMHGKKIPGRKYGFSTDFSETLKAKLSNQQSPVKRHYPLDYMNPMDDIFQLRKIDMNFRARLKSDGFEEELKKYEEGHENTWLFFIQGKYEGAYILLDGKFNFIAKIGPRSI